MTSRCDSAWQPCSSSALARRARSAAPRAGATPSESAAPRPSPGRSRSTGSGPAPEQKALPGRHRRVQEAVSRTSRSTTSRSATTCRRCSRRRSRAATRPTWRTSPSPVSCKQFANQGALKPIEFARAIARGELRARLARARHLQRQALRARLQGEQQVDRLVQRPGLQDRGRHAADDAGPQFAERPRTRCGRRARRPTRSAAPTAGRSPTCSRTSTSGRPGAAKYDLLSAHKIKWTDPSVKAALKTMAQVLGDTSNIVGGTSGALQTDFPTSVNNVFQTPPKAAMVIEGDFVPGVATVKAKPASDYNEFAFPSINGSKPSVVIGGDTIVTFKDTPAIRAFVKFLATPGGGRRSGRSAAGFATGNKNMPAERRTPTRSPARRPVAIAKAKSVRLRHVRPAAGRVRRHGRPGRVGASSRTSCSNPKDVTGIAAAARGGRERRRTRRRK